MGANAAEIALLLRRVALAFGRTPDQLRYVATSATIGGDAEIELRAFLRDLSGASDSAIRVVEGRRAPLPPGPPMSTAALDTLGPGVGSEERRVGKGGMRGFR